MLLILGIDIYNLGFSGSSVFILDVVRSVVLVCIICGMHEIPFKEMLFG